MWYMVWMWSKAMATSNSSSLKVTTALPLEKYARFLPEEEHGQVLPPKESTAQKKSGNWKVWLSWCSCSAIFIGSRPTQVIGLRYVMWHNFLYAAALSVFKRVLHTDEFVGVESSHDIQRDTSLCTYASFSI